MYESFEHQGSTPLATHARLDKVIIEQNDVSIQFIEGYMKDNAFISLGASHVSMKPEEYETYPGPKEALIDKLMPVVEEEEMEEETTEEEITEGPTEEPLIEEPAE